MLWTQLHEIIPLLLILLFFFFHISLFSLVHLLLFLLILLVSFFTFSPFFSCFHLLSQGLLWTQLHQIMAPMGGGSRAQLLRSIKWNKSNMSGCPITNKMPDGTKLAAVAGCSMHGKRKEKNKSGHLPKRKTFRHNWLPSSIATFVKRKNSEILQRLWNPLENPVHHIH